MWTDARVRAPISLKATKDHRLSCAPLLPRRNSAEGCASNLIPLILSFSHPGEGTRPRRGLRIAAVAALLLLPAACQQSRETKTASGVTVAPPTPRPQQLTDSTVSDPKTFNPLLSVDNASSTALRYVFDSLVRLNPLTTEIEPMLAERWEYDKAGTTCTFYLRRDVHWHDGVPFTAADVAFTLDAVYDPRVPNSAKHLLTIDGERIRTQIVDDHTIRLILPRPFAPLLNTIGIEILPKHILGAPLEQGTFAQQWGIDTPPEKIIGTGPYRMVRYVPAQFIQYRRFPGYWMRDDAGDALPYLEQWTTLIVPSQDTAFLKFGAGQTDLLQPRPEEITALRAAQDEMKIELEEVGLEAGSTFVSFNRNPRHYQHDGERDPKLDWFTDRRFLLAIAHAIDRKSMVQNCLFGYGRPSVAEISPENTFFHNPNLQPYAYDLAESRRLLAEGGYVDRDDDGVIEDAHGHPVEFSLYTNAENQVRQKMCSILLEDWTALGMKVDYRPLDFTALVEKLDTTFDWDAVLIGFTGGVEPHNGANILRSSSNLHLWNPRQASPATPWEKQIDELVEAGSRQLDRDKRRRIYWHIQQILHDQLAMIQTVRQTQFVAFRRYLENFRPTVWGLYRPELIRIAP